MSLKIICDLSDYSAWQGAVDTWQKIQDEDKVDDLERYLEELYPDGLTMTELNDILWFDGEQVLEDLGIKDEDEDEEDEDSDEE